MPQAKKPTEIPVEDWTIDVPADAADYLDGEPPVYDGEPAPPTPPAEPEGE